MRDSGWSSDGFSSYLLDLLRPGILAFNDDHVLCAADDIDVTVGHITHIAGVEPAVRHAGGGRFGVAVIASHQRRAGAPHLADGLVGERVARLDRKSVV